MFILQLNLFSHLFCSRFTIDGARVWNIGLHCWWSLSLESSLSHWRSLSLWLTSYKPWKSQQKCLNSHQWKYSLERKVLSLFYFITKCTPLAFDLRGLKYDSLSHQSGRFVWGVLHINHSNNNIIISWLPLQRFENKSKQWKNQLQVPIYYYYYYYKVINHNFI